MFASTVREFADRLVDELAPATAAEAESGDSPRLACLLDRASRVGLDDAELLSAIVEVTRAQHVLAGAQAMLVRAADRVGIPVRKRLSMTSMLMQIGVPPAVAYRTVRVGAFAESLEPVGRGLRDGSLSVEVADAVGAGVAAVGKRVPLDEVEKNLLARKLLVQETPAAVRKTATAEAIRLAGESEDADLVPAAENQELNEMTLTSDDEGRMVSSISLDVLTGEELAEALDPLMRPVPLPDGSRDPRTTDQRRADAFGQIVRSYLAGSDRPTSGGVLPHVSLVVPTAGAPGDGVASLGFTGPVSTATVGLTLCSSAVTAVVVDGEGVPLDVGREHRLMTPGIRKALAVRDCGCAFPGCGRPVSWTDAHHIVPWSEGGETSVGNGVLLCRMHHTLVHNSGWEVFLGHDGHPWFVAPGSRQPIRSHARRTLTSHADAAA